MATLEQLQEAQQALHDLMTGQQIVEITLNGRTTKFTPANCGQLRLYIEELNQQLNVMSNRRGPARLC